MGFRSRFRRFCSDRLESLSGIRGGRKSCYSSGPVNYRQRQCSNVFSRVNTLALLLVMLVAAGGWVAFHALNSSDVFRLREISVHGNRMTLKNQILARGRIEQGINLLSFDTDEAEQRISEHPWIDHAEVKRIWPFTLKIRVYEHRPLALINLEGEKGKELFYVDHHGKIFAKVDQVQDIDFPVITGARVTGNLLGSSIAEQGMLAEAFEFLRVAAQGNPIIPLQTVSEVHVSQGKGIIVYLVEHPFPIYMGYDSIDTRYYQLVKLLERLYRKKKIKDIKEIRMDYQTDRILVARLES